MQLDLPWRHDAEMATRRAPEQNGRFPNGVRALRIAAEMRQEDLADAMHVTTSAVGKLERGMRRLRIDQIQQLAKIFKVHPAEVLLPLSTFEREALHLVLTARADLQGKMVQMLRVMAEPAPTRAGKAA